MSLYLFCFRYGKKGKIVNQNAQFMPTLYITTMLIPNVSI